MVEYNWEDEFPGIPEDVLTKNQRDVVYLRYSCAMKFVEISEEVGRTKDAVIRSHRQALARVQRHLTLSKWIGVNLELIDD